MKLGLRGTFASALLLVTALMAPALVTGARADDIAGSFSGSSNPNGAWSYGQYVESTATFTLFTANDAFAGATPTCGLPNWSGSAESGGYPAVIANNTGSSVACGTWNLPTDTLNMHPTNTVGTDSDVRWTAPAAGTYAINGSYSALDFTTTLDSILVNGTSLFSTIINPSKTTPFLLTETLAAGDTIDFIVNCCEGADQNFFFDSTGLRGTITAGSTVPTPEPSSVLLMFLGSPFLFLSVFRHCLPLVSSRPHDREPSVVRADRRIGGLYACGRLRCYTSSETGRPFIRELVVREEC